MDLADSLLALRQEIQDKYGFESDFFFFADLKCLRSATETTRCPICALQAMQPYSWALSSVVPLDHMGWDPDHLCANLVQKFIKNIYNALVVHVGEQAAVNFDTYLRTETGCPSYL